MDRVDSIFHLATAPPQITLESDCMRLRRGRNVKVSEDLIAEARKIKARRAERAWKALQNVFGEADRPIHTFN
jgi:hypothetical protein